MVVRLQGSCDGGIVYRDTHRKREFETIEVTGRVELPFVRRRRNRATVSTRVVYHPWFLYKQIY